VYVVSGFRPDRPPEGGHYGRVLNVMNSNAITAVTYVSGPSFGRATDILPPRTLRAGVTFDF